MSELFIVGGLRGRQGKEVELRRDLIAVVEPLRNEKGNLCYERFVDESDPGLFVFAGMGHRSKRNRGATEAPHRMSHIQHFHANSLKNVAHKVFAHVLSRIS